MAAAPAAFGAPAGAIDREGAARRNWHGWKAPSRGFIVYPHRLHVFFLIIAGAGARARPRSPSSCLFQDVFFMAMQNRSRPTSAAIGGLCKGCSGGPRCWYLVGSGWSTASAARREHARPASDEFGRLWPDKGPSIVLGHAKEAGATAARAVEGVSECAAPHPARAQRMRACTGAATRTSWCSARMRAAAQQSRGRGGRCTRPRVTMGTRPRTTRTSRFLDAARGAAGGRQRLDRRHQEEEAEEEGEGRKVSATTARCSTTGLSPRGMRVRYIVR